MPRLLLADDDTVVLSVLTARLGDEFEIVGGAKDAAEAVALAAEHQPDVAIVDVQMPAGGAPAAIRGIRERSPGTAIVVFSADESRQGVLDVLGAGAMTYVRKDAPPEVLHERLHAAIAAHGHFNPTDT